MRNRNVLPSDRGHSPSVSARRRLRLFVRSLSSFFLSWIDAERKGAETFLTDRRAGNRRRARSSSSGDGGLRSGLLSQATRLVERLASLCL
jgi:hypothetical protein